jgi:plastocyanin
MRRSLLLTIIAAAVVLAIGGIVLAGRNNSPDTDTNTQSTPAPAPTPTPTPTESSQADEQSSQLADEGKDVAIANFAFAPATLTVKKGTTVTWTNNDTVAHTVTADSGEGPNSGDIDKGETYQYTFNTAGTFKYHCKPHPQMTATVIVTD